MINCLLIGKETDLNYYSGIISTLKFFGIISSLKVDETNNEKLYPDIDLYDAFIVVSPIKDSFDLFFNLIRTESNIYFVDQPDLQVSDLSRLEHIANESGNIIQPGIKELHHPLVQDFISTQSNHLLFRYSKSITGKKYIRESVLAALSFLTLLSPMPVKKIDINSIATTKSGRPTIKVRLKMYDSSICYIVIKIDNQKEHELLIETNAGNFCFNLAENYLENIHGTRFKSEETTDDDLVRMSLESFGLNIIMNKKPAYSFHHYVQSISILTKIENILIDNF
jgi:hypothetical protein